MYTPVTFNIGSIRTHAAKKVHNNLSLLSQYLILGLFLLRMHKKYGRKNIKSLLRLWKSMLKCNIKGATTSVKGRKRQLQLLRGSG